MSYAALADRMTVISSYRQNWFIESLRLNVAQVKGLFVWGGDALESQSLPLANNSQWRMSIHLPIHATASVARFDLISPPLWQFLKAFYSILQNFEPTSAIILCYWDFVIVFNGKILKNNLAIWSHWSRFRFQISKIAKIYGNHLFTFSVQ